MGHHPHDMLSGRDGDFFKIGDYVGYKYAQYTDISGDNASFPEYGYRYELIATDILWEDYYNREISKKCICEINGEENPNLDGKFSGRWMSIKNTPKLTPLWWSMQPVNRQKCSLIHSPERKGYRRIREVANCCCDYCFLARSRR